MDIPLAAVSFTMRLVSVFFIPTALSLVIVILIQKGRGGGLGAAIGGGAASGLFGTKTGDFLTWVTIAMTGIFLFLAVIMGLFYKPIVTQVEDLPSQVTAPAESPTDGELGQMPGTPAEDFGEETGHENRGTPESGGR
jgi:preprotein translocase subunit SecG